MTDHKRRVCIREHVCKRDSHLDQIEFEFIDAIRPLIAGYCCPEHELRRAFMIYDQNRNGNIELRELDHLIGMIRRSTTEEKISNFIERVNMSDDRSLNNESKTPALLKCT